MASSALRAASRAAEWRTKLAATYPWTMAPLIIGAPMRIMSGPQLAVAVSAAGGLGFIGPGATPQATASDLEAAVTLLKTAQSSYSPLQTHGKPLPLGVGFQTWNGDVEVAASAVGTYRPWAAWLFAPRHGQAELDTWTSRLRDASPETQIWIQVGTLSEAIDAARSSTPPDVLVIQGAEAGGHGRAVDGMGIVSLLPEIAEALHSSNIPLVAAGGVADGRGVVAALGLGAAGVVMGTRFLASSEARISKGYQDEVVRASDGATSTTRTQLYNHLRGTFDWPEQFSPRGIMNRSWEEHQAGVPFEELKRKHGEAAKSGDAGWGPEGRLATYAGASVGLVKSVADAGSIVRGVRTEAADIIQQLQGLGGSEGSASKDGGSAKA